MMLDEHNTKDWQQDGNGVFLLQECDSSRFSFGHSFCENKFSISVQSKNRADRNGEVEIAKRIADALNGQPWQIDRPTSGKWWVALHPSKRCEGKPFLYACQVASDGCVVTEEECLFRSADFVGALWLLKTDPEDPFTRKA